MTTIRTSTNLINGLLPHLGHKKDIRKHLGYILVESLGHDDGIVMVASSGPTMLAVHDKSGSLRINDCPAERGEKALFRVAKKFPGKSASVDIDLNAGIARTAGGVMAVETMDETYYPDWRQVVPRQLNDGDVGIKGAVNAQLLGLFGQSSAAFGLDKYNAMTCWQRDKHGSILIKFSTCPHITGVLMPLRVEPASPSSPWWISGSMTESETENAEAEAA